MSQRAVTCFGDASAFRKRSRIWEHNSTFLTYSDVPVRVSKLSMALMRVMDSHVLVDTIDAGGSHHHGATTDLV
jgi:hypothetical protein